MPDFAGLARGIIKSVASPLTDSFKQPVQWQHCTGSDGAGADTFAAPVTVNALVNRGKRQAYTASGALAEVIATLTFVDPLTAVDGRDIFTLPDGTTAPIVTVGGFEDPKTQAAFVTKVQIGVVIRGQ